MSIISQLVYLNKRFMREYICEVEILSNPVYRYPSYSALSYSLLKYE